MSNPQPYACPIQPIHEGLTWHESYYCSTHRILETVQTTNVPKDVEYAKDLWSSFQKVFGEHHVKTFDEIIFHINKTVKQEYDDAVKRAAYRWFPTLDIPNQQERNQKAWSLREGIKAGLFPKVTLEQNLALTAYNNNVDKWGRDLESSRTLISYAMTIAWLIAHSQNLNKYLAYPDVKNIHQSHEKSGNNKSTVYVETVFGEMLYLNNMIIQQTQNRAAYNQTRFHEDLLRVPEAYIETEKAYQTQLAAQLAAQREHEATQAAARTAAKEQTKIIGGVALGLAGAAVKGAATRSQRIRSKEAERAEREHLRNVRYNSEVQAKRNRKNGW